MLPGPTDGRGTERLTQRRRARGEERRGAHGPMDEEGRPWSGEGDHAFLLGREERRDNHGRTEERPTDHCKMQIAELQISD